MKGKLIVIEGTDCSGKETQTKMLTKRLEKENIACVRLCFPNYDSPTGKIVGGPYLGKDYICEGWFPEGAANVDPKVSSLYYAADRKYNVKNIEESAEQTIDCTGLYIMPGMIDMHCHLREPGFEYKETIETGSKSAVAGGFTTICPMPNTKPTPDSAIILQQIINKFKKCISVC